QGGALERFRVPTAAERNGDFSNTIDEKGVLLNFIKDPNISGTCSATVSTACFPGAQIPTNRFFSLGRAILNQYPLTNISGAGLAYNYETVHPTEKALSWEPAYRVDYQPSSNLRMTYKYSG